MAIVVFAQTIMASALRAIIGAGQVAQESHLQQIPAGLIVRQTLQKFDQLAAIPERPHAFSQNLPGLDGKFLQRFLFWGGVIAEYPRQPEALQFLGHALVGRQHKFLHQLM